MSRKGRGAAGSGRQSHRGGRGERPAARHALPRGVGLALTVIAAAGATISLYLTHVRHLVLLGAKGGALCSIDDWLDCRTVLASSYAAIGGVPISVFATWFYVVAAVLTVLGLRLSVLRLPRSPATALFVAYAAATGLSAVLAVVSATLVASLCPLCTALYALNTIALLFALRGVRATGESLSEAVGRERSYWRDRPGPAMRFAAVTLLGLVLVFAVSRVSARDGELCDLTAAAPKGNRLHVAIFSDFQCPHCQELDRALRPVRENEDVELDLHHFPLESDCNPRVARSRNRGSCLQASAALCADADGRLSDFSDRLFEAGPRDIGGLVALADSLGINTSRFTSCLRAAETAQTLNRDVRLAIDAGVRGTPTLFVNGRRVAHVPKAEGIACLLAYRRDQTAKTALQ